MSLIKVSGDKKVIEVSIPLTSISGKVRVKIRHAFSDYGISTATRKIPFSLKHYVEWQIGYFRKYFKIFRKTKTIYRR